MPIAVRSEGDYTVVHLSDVFDSETASELTELLQDLPPTRPLVIDFTFLRDRRLTALVSVVEGCTKREGVTLRGLSEFGVRLLQYLGKQKLLPAE